MKKLVMALSCLILCGTADGQVLGKALSLQQTGICPVLGCGQLKEVQISPRVKYVEGRKVNPDLSREPGGGVAAFYVDGKLAALGWQDVRNHDSLNIGPSAVNQLSKIGAGVGAPRELLAYVAGWSGPWMSLDGKTFAVRNAIFKSANAADRRGILLIDRNHYQIVSSAINRDDRKTGLWLVQDFFKKYGIKANKIGPYEYRIQYSEAVIENAQRYFVNDKKLEDRACCGHRGKNFIFQGLSATNIDFFSDHENEQSSPKIISIIISNRQ